MTTLTCTLSFLKETKNTYVYEENTENGTRLPVVGRVYLQKALIGKERPTSLKVTVEALS